jgi:acetylornithine/N-succinyldiaminopimelate aminotransferase
MSHLMNTYARLPVAFTRGEGVWLWDAQGKRYLDALAGVAVNAIGHSHPKLVAALRDQVGKLIHTSNIYHIEAQEKLADKIAQLSGMESVFFCNSGAEANEAAIKIARYYGHKKGVENPNIVVLEKSFHGRTLATLSATGSRKVQAGFEPLVSGFVRVPFDDLEAVRRVAASNKNVVAILAELVQGEGGVCVCDKGYLQGLREICDTNGWLLMLDEVQTGIGRTGKMFGFQHYGVTPDVMTLAKGLGGGVPIGACVTKGKAATLFQPGSHGSTFGGNILASTAGLATLDIVESENVCQNAAEMGEHIRASLKRALAETPGVKEIRGQGLLIGIELDRPCGDLVKTALGAGLLINVTADTVVRLVPPLIISRAEADQLVNELTPLIRSFLMKPAAAAA